MTESSRIVVACDAACDIRIAVQEAAELAASWNAALHGIFLEDENLYRLAALPIARQVSLSDPAAKELDAGELERMSVVLRNAMQRAVAEAAAQHGLRWSFDTLRSLPAAALSAIEADLLLVDASTRPFAASWGPASAWSTLPGEKARAVLIRRRRRLAPGNIVVLADELPDVEQALKSVIAVARPGREIAVILSDAAADAHTLAQTAASLAKSLAVKIRIERGTADLAELLERIQAADPSLLVVADQGADPEALREIIAATTCDLLLLR